MMNSEQQLKKELGASQYFTLAFGTIIGVAWVVVMGDWLNQAGPVGAILAFALGGLVMVLIGLCYAEISVMIPAPGGILAWGYQNFGQKTGFALGWLISMSCIAVTSFEACSKTRYIPGSSAKLRAALARGRCPICLRACRRR